MLAQMTHDWKKEWIYNQVDKNALTMRPKKTILRQKETILKLFPSLFHLQSLTDVDRYN